MKGPLAPRSSQSGHLAHVVVAQLVDNSWQFLRDVRAPFLLSLGAAMTLPWCALVGYAVVKGLEAVTGQR
jgi:hypothetical protein